MNLISNHYYFVDHLTIYLCHFFSIGFRVERGLREQYGVLLGSHSELVVEGVMPDLLHVVPVGDDSMLDGVLQGQDAPLTLGLVPHVTTLPAHANHGNLKMETSIKIGGQQSTTINKTMKNAMVITVDTRVLGIRLLVIILYTY
jgi:hypothetical protein